MTDGRDQAHGHGGCQDGGQIDERHRHAGQVAKEGRCLMGGIAGDFQAARYDEQVQVGDDGEHDARQGDGDSQDDEAL